MPMHQIALVAAALTVSAAVVMADTSPSPLRHVRTVTLDESAWRFFNMASFDQDKVVTFGDYQYTVYWDADAVLVVVRRSLRDHTFQAVRLPQYTLTINPKDGHRNTVLGVSAEDGRLHLSWDHHNNPLRYTKSRAGFLTDPPATVTGDDFEPAQPLIPDDELESRVTYPRFVADDRGTLFFIYRQGSSGGGDTYLHRYSGDTATWTRIGATSLFSRRGTYPAWQNSTSRNAYPNDVLFGSRGRLHVTWVFREAGATWASNHDLHYACSDDGGRTWLNNAGAGIANLPEGDPIELADPDIVVREIPVFSWIMNQTTMAMDPAGRPHVITFKLPEPYKPEKLAHDPPKHIQPQFRMFHYWRDDDGAWRGGEPITYLRTRPGAVFDAEGNMYVYLATPDGLLCHSAKAADRWATWASATIPVPDAGLITAGKPDRVRMSRDGVLSFAAVTQGTDGGRGYALLDFDLRTQ